MKIETKEIKGMSVSSEIMCERLFEAGYRIIDINDGMMEELYEHNS